MSPPVGRQAKTVTKATWVRRAGGRSSLAHRRWATVENKGKGIEGKLAPSLWDFVDQKNKTQYGGRLIKGCHFF